MDPDRPAVTLRIHAPEDLLNEHGDDVINPVISIDLDNQRFTYQPNDDPAAAIELPIDQDAIQTIGHVLLWTLKLRVQNHLDLDPTTHATMELF